MQINITTFAGRQLHYINETLRSLLASEWAETNAQVNLIMGSEDERHVRKYAAHPSVRIVPWDAETLPNLRHNATLNKMRALRFGDDGPMVICEDDVRFPPNWLSTLRQATAELDEDEYVLSLFAATNLLDKADLITGKSWIKEYPSLALQGAQALYYPNKGVRLKVADYLEANLIVACGDELIGRYARIYAELYATKEPIVENIGGISCFE